MKAYWLFGDFITVEARCLANFALRFRDCFEKIVEGAVSGNNYFGHSDKIVVSGLYNVLDIFPLYFEIITE